MALLTVQELTALSAAGSVVALTAVSASDTFANDGRTIYEINNGSGGTITATFTAVSACSHGSTHDVVGSIAAGVRKRFGPFDPVRFGTTVTVVHSGTTTVTANPVRLV
jgi:hypothetical protein